MECLPVIFFFNLTSINYFSSYFVPNEIRFHEKFCRWLIGFKAFWIHSAFPLILLFFSQERNEVTGKRITPAHLFWFKRAWNKCHSFSQTIICHFRVGNFFIFILSLCCVTLFFPCNWIVPKIIWCVKTENKVLRDQPLLYTHFNYVQLY